MTELVTAKAFGITAVGAAFGSVGFALTDAVAISLVNGVVAVLMSAVAAYFGYKAKIAAEKGQTAAEEGKAAAETTGKALDGHLTEFKAMAKESFTAKGVLQEKEAEHIRKADASISIAEGVAKEKSDEALRKIDPNKPPGGKTPEETKGNP